MVLGLYYLSIQAENEPGQGMVFSDMGELHHALESKVVTLHTKIKGRFKSVDADGNPTSKIYETTAWPHDHGRTSARTSECLRSMSATS
jgi:DNA-directed RNA polymerase subunit beta'